MRERISAVLDGAVDYEAGLDALVVAPSAEVDRALLGVLRESFARLWRTGWQPADLHRVVTRRGDAGHAEMVADAVAADLRRFPAATVDDRWLAQADAIGAHVWWDSDDAYLSEIATRARLDRVAVVYLVLDLLVILSDLPAIEVLIPPPGTAPEQPDPRGLDVRLLHRVRALLAKAESTTFPAEAEAYTAKAQELMTRHSLDVALLDARSADPTVVPLARRVGIDPPYESEKASLLHAVAGANHCHVVWSPEFGYSTVFGFDADIDAVELLHASLLVQAHRAMARAEPPSGKAGRARLRAFRQSFLVAFAVRIGERLAGSAAAALAEAARAGIPADALPVLASRDEKVRESMRTVFPQTVAARGSRVDSTEGWDSGRAAADRAGLRPARAR